MIPAERGYTFGFWFYAPSRGLIQATLDVLAAFWLWQRRRRGAVLGLATTPLALGLGAGFALPFLLLGVPIRVGLVVAGRDALR